VQKLKNKKMENNIEGFKLKAEAQLIQIREERKQRIKEYWENLPKINTPRDVPELPKVDIQEWKDYYVPKLIEAGAIPKKDLVEGQYYIGEHRNAQVAKWNGKEFVYMRTKFQNVFEDTCNHFEDDDGFALFVPIGIGTEEKYKQNCL
jgi:hypothetical protein